MRSLSDLSVGLIDKKMTRESRARLRKKLGIRGEMSPREKRLEVESLKAIERRYKADEIENRIVRRTKQFIDENRELFDELSRL